MTTRWPSRKGINDALLDLQNHWDDLGPGERAQARTAMHFLGGGDCGGAVAEAAAARTIIAETYSILNTKSAIGHGHVDAWLVLKAYLDNPSPAVERLEWRLAPQPCGHPGACIVGDEDSDMVTISCAWCEEVAGLREQLKQWGDFAGHSSSVVGKEMAEMERRLELDREHAVDLRHKWHEALVELEEERERTKALERRLAQTEELERRLGQLQKERLDGWMNSAFNQVAFSLGFKTIDALTKAVEQLTPMPCGHPGACVVSGDEGTGHCAWCEDAEELAGANLALDVLHDCLKAAEARAEALAALVPDTELLQKAEGALRRLGGLTSIEAVRKDLRALAARIKDARKDSDDWH